MPLKRFDATRPSWPVRSPRSPGVRTPRIRNEYHEAPVRPRFDTIVSYDQGDGAADAAAQTALLRFGPPARGTTRRSGYVVGG
jgi:hypothetical protein